MRTAFSFFNSGLLLTAVANRNVTTDASLFLSLSHARTHARARTNTHTHTHTHTCANTHTRARAHKHTHTHVMCLSHEIQRLSWECCSRVHCSECTHPCRIQTTTELQTDIFDQELRHPRIDKICVMLSRASETCFPHFVSFYI